MDKQKKIGILLSYIGQVVHIVTGIIYAPIMICYLGQSEYGLYQLAISIVSYLTLLYFGFNSSYTKFYASKKVLKDEEGITKINGMFLTIFTIISILCLISGLIVTNNVEVIFAKGLSSIEYRKLKTLLTILVLSYSIAIFNTTFNNIIQAQERFIFQKALILCQYIVNPFILVPLLVLGYSSIAIVSVSLATEIVILGINIYYCLKVLKVGFNFNNFDYGLLKEICRFTFFIFLFQIADRINLYIGNILVGRFEGSDKVAIYSIATQICVIYSTFGETIKNIYVPEINRLVSKTNDNKKISECFIKVSRIEYIIIVWILLGFILFGKQFICLWVGDNFDTAYYVCLILLIGNTVWLIQSSGHEIQIAKDEHKVSSIVCLLFSLLNVVISIPLTKKYGIIGTAFGTSSSLLLYSFLFLNLYYCKVIKLDIKLLVTNLKAYILPTFLSIGLGLIYVKLVDCYNLLFLVIGILLFSVIYFITMYYLGMNKEEKSIFKIF